MPYRRKTIRNRKQKRTQRKRRTQRRTRTQRRSQKKTMKGGVDTPIFGDESMIQETEEERDTHFLDDSDITPPFDTDVSDYGETTTESVSNDSSLGFGGKKMQRQQKRRRNAKKQRAGGFTMTEETNPRSYEDDYEKNIANIEEVILSS